jgi:L-cysteine:1D-myo-inositol 2-amino-2-deoxy-alpha-D-glucopyranoside ligase
VAAAPPAADTVARLRTHLADDLDTPAALAALDAWAHDTLEYGGADPAAGADIAAAVDALLGVRLR